jgi:hypothetical protein
MQDGLHAFQTHMMCSPWQQELCGFISLLLESVGQGCFANFKSLACFSGALQLFDDVMIMTEGSIIYHGGCSEVGCDLQMLQFKSLLTGWSSDPRPSAAWSTTSRSCAVVCGLSLMEAFDLQSTLDIDLC